MSDARVLRKMVQELKDEPVPDIDWDRVEAGLFQDEGQDEVRPSAVPGALCAAVPTSAVPREPADAPAQHALGGRGPRSRGLVARGAGSSVVRWSRGVAGAAGVAAAAAFAWFVADPAGDGDPVAVVAEPIDPAKVPAAPGMGARVLDVGALEAGDVVEATMGPLTFGRMGVLSWTLSAGGRLVVRETIQAEAHVVELESGSVRASAVGGKPFVIRAGDTEIAAIGDGSTVTVTRSSRGLVLQVEQGSALVGAHGTRSKGASARVLSAPVRATVSLDGAKTVEVIPDEIVTASQPAPDHPADVDAPSDAVDPSAAAAPDSERAPKPVAALPPESREDGSREERPTVSEPSPPAQGPISEAAIVGTLTPCFASVRASAPAAAAGGSGKEVSLTRSSTLVIGVRDDGSVKSVAFNPPMLPALQNCAVFLFEKNLGPGARTVRIPVEIK